MVVDQHDYAQRSTSSKDVGQLAAVYLLNLRSQLQRFRMFFIFGCAFILPSPRYQ